jgi:hypothetical protein
MLYGKSGILNPTGLGSRLVCVGRERPREEDLVTENNSNRPPKKQMRSAVEAALPRIGVRCTTLRGFGLPSRFYFIGGKNGSGSEAVCGAGFGKADNLDFTPIGRKR